jgi:hypothetical protein
MTQDERSRALAELLATPLDRDSPEPPDDDLQPSRPAPWGMLLALIVGAAIVLAGFSLANRGADEDPTPTTTLAPPTTAPSTVAAFPAGYTPIDDVVAARVVRVGESGPDLAITLSSVSARGLDAAASTPFTGGRWAAVLRDGTTVAALGQIADAGTPGVVTALFDPAAVPAEDLVAVRLSERWFNQSTSVTQDLEITGLPWTLPEPAVLDLGEGNQLVVSSLELSETGGFAEWSLVGGPALGVVSLEVALDEGFFDGQPRMMIPVGRIDRFFFDPATAVPDGRIELSGPTAADGTGIASGIASWSVRLTVTAPAEAEIPVPDFES